MPMRVIGRRFLPLYTPLGLMPIAALSATGLAITREARSPPADLIATHHPPTTLPLPGAMQLVVMP